MDEKTKRDGERREEEGKLEGRKERGKEGGMSDTL